VDAGKGRVQLGWKEKGFKESFTAQSLSDGTLKFLCLLSILFNPEPPLVLFIDEPDNSLHPKMLALLAEIIQVVSDRMQIFITTHSPSFLSYFKPEHLVIVEKNQEGASTLRKLKKKGLEHWLKDFTMGELWEMGNFED
jgi:predicted ATPase